MRDIIAFFGKVVGKEKIFLVPTDSNIAWGSFCEGDVVDIAPTFGGRFDIRFKGGHINVLNVYGVDPFL